MAFSTKDRDNDLHSTTHCAQYNMAGWWYDGCCFCNLNGRYGHYATGNIHWSAFHDNRYSLKKVDMKLRP